MAVRAGGAIVAAGLTWTMSAGAASAASDVDVGGYHDMALRAAQRSLLADPPEGAWTAGFRSPSGPGRVRR